MRIKVENLISLARTQWGSVALLSLILTACQDGQRPLYYASFGERSVATVYRVNAQAGTGATVRCHRAPNSDSRTITYLKDGQLVDLVSVQAGMLRRGANYWLLVYPPFSHRPACYVNVRYLIPYA